MNFSTMIGRMNDPNYIPEEENPFEKKKPAPIFLRAFECDDIYRFGEDDRK